MRWIERSILLELILLSHHKEIPNYFCQLPVVLYADYRKSTDD